MNTQEQIIFNTANRLLAGTKTAAICIDLSDGKSAYLGDDAGVMRMLQNKDQSGAAIRGEAVAELPARRFVHVTGFIDADYVEFKAGQNYGGGVCAGVERESKHYTREDAEECVRNGAWREVGALSARAADAPSEPSDQLYSAVMNIPCERAMSHFVTLAEFRAYKEGHHAARHAAVNLVAAFKSRAADALDSQPGTDEPTEREALIACLGDDAVTLLRANPDDEMAQTMREAAAMLENDGKALDSQPTDPYPLLRAAFTTAESGVDGYFVKFRFPTLQAMQDAHRQWHGVSSQPTDGGVRNEAP